MAEMHRLARLDPRGQIQKFYREKSTAINLFCLYLGDLAEGDLKARHPILRMGGFQAAEEAEVRS